MNKGLQSQALEIQLVLELLVKEIESTRDVKILGLKGHLEKVKFLLGGIKSGREEEKLEFPALEMQLKENTVQTESQTKSWKMERLYAKTLEKQLHERIEKLKSLQEKIELAQMMENLKCRPLEMELNRHMMELRFAPSIIKMEYSAKTKYHWLKIEFKQHMAKVESLLLEMKLEQEEEGPGYKAFKIALEEYIVKLVLLLKEGPLKCSTLTFWYRFDLITTRYHHNRGRRARFFSSRVSYYPNSNATFHFERISVSGDVSPNPGRQLPREI